MSELPRQALKCRLTGVPPAGHYWSDQATKALRDLVPESQQVILKVTGGPADCPNVEIHLPNSNDGSINFDLSTEFDIFPLSPTEKMGETGVTNGTSSPPASLTQLSIDPSSAPANGSGPTSPASPLLSQDLASLKTLLAPVVPSEGQYFDINITFAVSPSSFVVQPYNEGNKLELLMTELNTFYTNEEHLQEVNPSDLSEGEYFAARHTDGFWYRVRVTKVIDNEHAAVRYVDYGDLTMVSVSDLQPLWGQFRNLPYQAINARLANVVPAEGDWKPEDTVWFNNRVSDKQFVSIIKSVDGGTEPIVDLVLIDTSHPNEDKFIDQELVQDGRAVSTQSQ